MTDDPERLEGVGSEDASHELTTYEDLTSQLNGFEERYGSPTNLAYPGSSTDITPSEALEETDVVYIDINEDAIEVLESGGYEAVVANANNFDGKDDFEAILLYNQDFEGVVNFAERNLADSGIVICDQYHNAASAFVEQEGYALDGRFPVQGNPGFDPNPEDCFERVESDEEFRDARPEQFQTNRNLVDRYVGENHGVIESMTEVVEKLGDKPMSEAQEESHIRLGLATNMFMRPEAWSPPVKKGRKPEDLFVFEKK